MSSSSSEIPSLGKNIDGEFVESVETQNFVTYQVNKQVQQLLSEQQIAELVRSYRVGRNREIPTSLAASVQLLGECIDRQLKSRLSSTDLDFLYLIKNEAFHGLVLARQGLLIESIENLNATATRLQEVSLSEVSLSKETILICRSFFEAAAAYVDYKCQRWNRAEKRLLFALEIDKLLEQEYQYSLFHFHQIQLIHNLIRLYSRFNQEKAVNIANSVVKYLIGKSQELPILGSFNSSQIITNHPELTQILLCQFVGEIGLLLAEKESKTARHLLNKFEVWKSLSSVSCGKRLYKWCKAKRAFLECQTDDFINLSSQFLVEGHDATAFTILWYAIVVDIMCFLEERQIEALFPFREEVLEDIEEWQDCPKQIKHLLLRGIFKEK